MQPVICMITDGRLHAARSPDALIAVITAAARAGVNLVQVRERGIDDRVLAEVVGRCVSEVRQTRTRVIINDRLDVALAAGAHGVHLRSDSFPASRIRAVTPPGFLVGQSVHSPEEAGRAVDGHAVDYLIFGSVFETASKPGRTPAGVAELTQVVRSTAVPVLAVGGIDVDNVAQVARAGAAGVAAIGFFADVPISSLATAVERLTRAFDTAEGGS
jgi:thiamine-phosphate pyrophosphorylase